MFLWLPSYMECKIIHIYLDAVYHWSDTEYWALGSSILKTSGYNWLIDVPFDVSGMKKGDQPP